MSWIFNLSVTSYGEDLYGVEKEGASQSLVQMINKNDFKILIGKDI